MEETEDIHGVDPLTEVSVPVVVSSIRCTKYCGFSVTGTPDYCQKTYRVHNHESEDDSWEPQPKTWYEYLFSFYGLMIVLFVCGAVVSIANKDLSIF